MGNYFDVVSLISGLCLGLTGAVIFRSMNIHTLFISLFKKTKALPMVNSNDMKMVIVVRTDLNMGKGKIAAQCCHAALGCYQRAEKRSPEYLTRWLSKGQPKIVVKLDNQGNEKTLYGLEHMARELEVPCKVIHDAGHTQVMSGTATCAGFGPAPSPLLDKITGHLKLL